jgi:PAS domain S-box-containing protein
MRVLVAEHEPMWREFLCPRLQHRGMNPLQVVNGDRAWSILEEKEAPRLAIIDRRIPSLDAMEICRRLRRRADPFYTYVVLVLPNAHRTEELLALEAGADDCLPKPFGEEELIARLVIAERTLDVDKRLSHINRRWRTMLDALPFGVAAVDSKGMLKRMNTTFARQMGYSSVQSLLGQSLTYLFQTRLDLHQFLQEVQMVEPFDTVEVRCRGGKGLPAAMRLWGRPLPENDEAVYEIITQELF